MLSKLQNINTGIIEFLFKFVLVSFLIMPACILGCFWIGVQIDSVLNINFLKFIFPLIGTVAGFSFTALLIVSGHTKQRAADTPEDLDKAHCFNAATNSSGYGGAASPSRTSTGYATPFFLNRGK